MPPNGWETNTSDSATAAAERSRRENAELERRAEEARAREAEVHDIGGLPAAPFLPSEEPWLFWEKQAEAIRNLALNGAADRWSPLTESLLMYAARRDHIERRIQPALDLGQVVLCDRFADSTRAYQGAGGGVATSFIDALEANIVQDCVPDLTLIFDMPVEEGLRRAAARGDFEARFESKGLEFHQRLREGFLKIAADQPRRCLVINAAAGDVDTVADLVWAAVEPRLPQHG